MTWLWIALSVAAVAAVVALLYWQMIVAEGTYLGSRVVAKTYDWVARRYDTIKQFSPREESWYVAAPLLRALGGVRHPLLLDVATGTGRLPVALLRERFSGQIVGLDLSLGMLREASAKLSPYASQVRFVCQDAGHLPFDDESFDAVTCLESLEFFPRPLAGLAEIVRVLRPGGVLMVTNRVGREARLLPGRAMPRARFEQELASLGLTDVQVRRWQVSYDLVVGRKEGPLAIVGNGSRDLTTLLRCPNCTGKLSGNPTAVSCPDCLVSYPVREGIVRLST